MSNILRACLFFHLMRTPVRLDRLSIRRRGVAAAEVFLDSQRAQRVDHGTGMALSLG